MNPRIFLLPLENIIRINTPLSRKISKHSSLYNNKFDCLVHEILLIRELTPSLLKNSTEFEQNFLRDSAYFIYANHQPKKNCHFVSNHFELENDVKMTLERRSYPRYLWARQLVTCANV